MKCYFVRHGKTQWNLEGRFQGANGDSPLLKESIHDLEKLGDYLQDISFDAVFSSDLKRAKDTCQIIMSRNQHPQTITFEPAFARMAPRQIRRQQNCDNQRHLSTSNASFSPQPSQIQQQHF